MVNPISFKSLGRPIATITLTGLSLALIGASSAPVGVQQRIAAPEVRITAADYAFVNVPVTIRRGLTFFSFTNGGKVRHEMSMMRLEPGVTVDALLQNLKGGGIGRAKFMKPLGLLIEPGGKSSISWLAVDLKKGETYVITCSLKDRPDAPAHISMGMVASFTVR